MDDRKDVGLAELAALLRERNALDARLGRLLNRPVNTGHIGEWIAARIFGIELENAANAAGYDGRFMTGDALNGRSVNVKAYTKHEAILDINLSAPLDYYLVFTGRKAAGGSSRGTLRPFLEGLNGTMTMASVMMMLMQPPEFDTVYVNVSCPPSNN
ncbi:MAG TPA: hypothetical protein VET27_13350 [Mycobacterium sp.]|nr:hypothetical protein [Mycobacterium sp.]